ncbi:hypothetical protein T4A_1537, partial [Trichinella pseudospiralis]
LPPGYASGQIKICIYPQVAPQAIFCTIFALRGLCKFLFALEHCLRANMQIYLTQGIACRDMQIFIFP